MAEKNHNADELTREFKAYMLTIATIDLNINEKIRPLLVAVKITTSSLYKCFTGEKRLISYPKLV